jgi:hypothetical protein
MFCGTQRSLLVPPAKIWEQQLVIRPVGTRIWENLGWDGRGHRGIINMDLGSISRYMYPGMVSVGGCMGAARS